MIRWALSALGSLNIYSPWPSPLPSSLYLRTPPIAQSSAKLSGGGDEKRIFLPHRACRLVKLGLQAAKKPGGRPGFFGTLTWAHNTYCGVILNLFVNIDILFPTGRCFWKWIIRFSWIQLEYNTARDRTWPWKGLSGSFSLLAIYWNWMCWHSCMVPW